MRLLMVSNYFPPYTRGGYELWCRDMALEFTARGHDVTVLTSEGDRPGPHYEAGLAVHRTLELEVQGGLPSTLRRLCDRKSRERRNADAVQRAAQEAQPDAAVIWGMWNISRSVPVTAEQLLPRRTMYFLADYWLTLDNAYVQQLSAPSSRRISRGVKKAVSKPLLRLLGRDAAPSALSLTHAVCCSEYLRTHLVQTGILPPTAGVIHGGVDYQLFSSVRRREPNSRDHVRMVYLGRLTPEKGVHTAIEALSLLSNRHSPFSFELGILGTGNKDYLSALNRQARLLGVAARVRFLGWKSIDDIPDVFRDFDICLFTSTWPEPFGRSILEAMSAGLLVVGTDVGGSREIFERYDRSVTFSPGDAHGLAERILYVWNRPALRQHLLQRGRQLAQCDFSLRTMADGMERYLQRVVDAR
jgi:glycosyltransferase involved in cell wall biosynthesis